MLGIDTNILVRYITQDDPIQSPLVSQFLKPECTEKNPCYLSNIVLCEMVWVLETAYHYKREQIANVLQIILETSGFIVENSARILCALEVYRAQGVDFSDALLGEINQLRGCEITVTLDKKASKIGTFRLLATMKKSENE